jgi:hypothetical protein
MALALYDPAGSPACVVGMIIKFINFIKFIKFAGRGVDA